jgi:hypothetical protein
MKTMTERRARPRDYPLEALQLLAELGLGLDDAAALERVSGALQRGVPKCCLVFDALFYGRALDAGRYDLLAGYRTWMSRATPGPLEYVPCPRCVMEGNIPRGAGSTR